MARPKIELENTTYSSKEFGEIMTKEAINGGVPAWAAEEIYPGFSDNQLKLIDQHMDRKKEMKFLTWVFPELKHKIKYRYEKYENKNSDRSLFKNRVRTLLRSNLENNGISARTLTESMMEFIFGYKIDELMDHIGKQFTADMTWENQGLVWHLDHIYPCSKLKYNSVHDNNFKKLWNLDNLRPLCKHENMRKFNKIIHGGENEEKRT